jgi:ribosomal protein S12 methylthiotransferase RimO
MPEAMKIGFVSLGCPKNLIDTEVMLHSLAVAGYEITPEETEADIIIINTCAFIESAKQESIDSILDIAWLKANHSLKGIVVTGCLAQRYRDEIFAELPEVDAILGVGSISEIVNAVKSVEAAIGNENTEKFTSFNDCESSALGGDRIVTTGDHTAYIKISEGCSNRCTYCAIPQIRGKFRSRDLDSIISEAKTLDEIGVKELCIVAQDTTAYGIDIYGEYRLPELLRRLKAETSIPWLRLMYCYPDKITDELIDEIAANDRVLKYIDLPVQHISDSVLSRMNRKGDGAMIRSTIAKLRQKIPSIVIRTTVIVGFPGETEADFTELCEFVKETKFEHLGAFAYSREEDTPAYSLPNQIDDQTKQDRCDIIMSEQLDINAARQESKIGSSVTVLCEGFDYVAEAYYGRSPDDAPDIDGKIYFMAEKDKYNQGDMLTLTIIEALDYDLIGAIE